MASNNNQNINPRPCVYNCGIQIYWNSSVNEYWEVFTKKKHICPNRGNKPSGNTIITTAEGGITPPSDSPKPRYYNPFAKKLTPYASSFAGQSKPKMSNSFELLNGPIDTIQKKYEVLYDIVIVEYGGKVHGSQSHIVANNNSMQLIVYYEVPLGMRYEVKRKFENLILNYIRSLDKTIT